MILLDTDHVSLLKYPESERGARLERKLGALPRGEVVATSIVSIEEQMRGWLAAIAKERESRRQASNTFVSTKTSAFIQLLTRYAG